MNSITLNIVLTYVQVPYVNYAGETEESKAVRVQPVVRPQTIDHHHHQTPSQQDIQPPGTVYKIDHHHVLYVSPDVSPSEICGTVKLQIGYYKKV